MTEGRFRIDDEGFKTQMSEVPLWRLIQEIISNSFDEDAVTKISCTLTQVFDSKVQVTIEDNGNGFKKIEDIYTLYGDSYKRTNTKKAGRFNEGEKRFLAVAEHGLVATKNIRVIFEGNSKKEEKIPMRKGTLVTGIFSLIGTNMYLLENKLRLVAVPKGKQLKINDVIVQPKKIVKSFKANLYTVKAEGKNQKLVQVKEETDVFLYEKSKDDKPLIYELGIPIQELQEDLKWHVDIRQKVPQTTDRNVVSDKYLQTLYAKITENTIDLISDNDSGSNWINDALKKTKPEVSKEILKKRYGTEKVMIQSSNYRDNERALEDGVVLIKGSQLDSDVKENLKSTEVLKYASKEYSTNAFEYAKPVEPTEKMRFFGRVCNAVAKDTIGKEITNDFVSTKDTSELAQYGCENISWNVTNLGGKKFFEKFSQKAIGILIHELSHDKKGNNDGHAHLSHDFYHEMERIAGIVGEKGIQYWINKVENEN